MVTDTQVKTGYKQTDIGVIPNSWNLVHLADICFFENGDRSSNYPSEQEFTESGIPFINAGHISNGKISNRNMDYIPNYVYDRLGGGKVSPGDILFCLRGSLGKFGVVTSDFGKGAIASSLVIVRPKPGKTTTSFLSFYFGSEICNRMIKLWAGGAAQPNLGAKELGLFLLPLPSETEQTAIVEILSDIDSILYKLDQLIEKKRNIKQGTMQELLTGKRRLPGFSDEWVTSKLGDVCSYQNGTSLEKYFNSSDGYKVISIGNYSTGGKYIDNATYIDKKFSNEIGKFILDENDLTMILNDKTSTGEIIGRVLLIEESKKYVFNQRTMRLAPKNLILPTYLYFLINSDFIHNKIRGLAKPGTQIYINTKDVTELELYYPKSKEEQTALATFLMAMEKEITLLESIKNKYLDIKQGMMQQLLTGRIRLI